jgi:hypothetical protein
MKKGISIVGIIGWLVTSAAIVALWLLLYPAAKRPGYFWGMIAWTEFLNLLVWGGITFFPLLFVPDDRNRRGLGGVYPTAAIIVYVYAALSFLFLLGLALFPESAFFRGFQIPGQVILLVLAGVLVMILFFSLMGARAGAEPLPEGLLSPTELATMLNVEASRFTGKGEKAVNLHDELRLLGEKIEHSLPHVGRIGRNEHYMAYTKEIQALCAEVASLDTGADEGIEKALETVAKLSSKVALLVESLKRK